MNLIKQIFSRTKHNEVIQDVVDNNVSELKEIVDNKDKKQKVINIPPGRVSYEENISDSILGINEAKTSEYLKYIPLIRALSKKNEDVGQVFNDLIQLTNTGHKISFDPKIKPELANQMRKHLEDKRKNWGSAVHNINGLVNKWIGQIWVSGALSSEWVIKDDLSGIQNSVLVNPENIRFKYNNKTTFYEPYQKVKNNLIIKKGIDDLIKLNTYTYFYAGILGDTDSPYGIPPFLTAIESLTDQKVMKKNINHILKQLGLLGYLEVKIDKPDMNAGESVNAYKNRLNDLLVQTKKKVKEGFSEGVVVGFQEDHEFEFHSTVKQINGVSEVFNMNETQVANGLKTTPSFIGQKSSGTETNMGIVFTKMLSQLKSVQSIVAEHLQKGYLLELLLAGYDLNYVKVEFKPSTVTDDLKFWQAKEIKQRTLHNLRIDNIISQETYAEEMGYDEPNGKEPLIPYDQQMGKAKETDPVKKSKRESDKDKSDRKTRDKNKNQPRRKDRDTKPV